MQQQVEDLVAVGFTTLPRLQQQLWRAEEGEYAGHGVTIVSAELQRLPQRRKLWSPMGGLRCAEPGMTAYLSDGDATRGIVGHDPCEQMSEVRGQTIGDGQLALRAAVGVRGGRRGGGEGERSSDEQVKTHSQRVDALGFGVWRVPLQRGLRSDERRRLQSGDTLAGEHGTQRAQLEVTMRVGHKVIQCQVAGHEQVPQTTSECVHHLTKDRQTSFGREFHVSTV
mmetsp:Transcript_20811/g.52688  ORF Transcript_20811/g.52688 Transcript_20811/m.52688 type:complete len:225 (-) Transcript_20811:386-1060(-)